MTRSIMWFLAGIALVALLAYCTGCASSGLYAMSDQWCAAHPNASAAHCK